MSAAACADSSAPHSPGGAGVAISVAPLQLGGVTNARYRLVIENGSGEVVTDVELSADQYGDGAGSLSYVAPCDADDNDNEVRLTLLDLYEGGGATPIAPSTYNNPGPLSRIVTCEADTDVAVTFDLTIARDASQGFFDVAVEFNQIFCSAKLDCLENATDPNSAIDLLFNNGQRDTTFVLGFACTGGLGDVETWQYLDDINVTCGSDTVLVDVGAGTGNLPASAITQEAGTQSPLFGAGVYRGEEVFPTYHKQYWNVLLGFSGGQGCRVTTVGTASDGELAADTTPSGATWPLITWDVNLTDAASAQVCTQHPLNAATCPSWGVCVAYTPLSTPKAFDNAFYAPALALPAQDPAHAGSSCASILAETPTAPSGSYYLDVNGAVTLAYCDMDNDGGGWTLVAIKGTDATNTDEQADGPSGAIDADGNNLNTTSYKGFSSANIHTLITEAIRISDGTNKVFWRPGNNSQNVFSTQGASQQCKANLGDAWSVSFTETCCHTGFNTWSSQAGQWMCGFDYQWSDTRGTRNNFAGHTIWAR